MKLFLLEDPDLAERFARYTYSGTWTEGVLCGNCRRATSELIPPLIVEWEEGSNVLGDFAWCGGTYRCVVPQQTRDRLAFLNPDTRWGRVRVNPPERKRARHPRIPYPYTGPRLWWPIPKHRVFINRAEARKIQCPECGQFVGQSLLSGIILHKDEVGNRQVFRVAENGRSTAMFVTEPVANRIGDLSLSNIALVEAGEILG